MNRVMGAAALAAAFAMPAHAAPANLVVNGGFEQLQPDATGSRPVSFEVGPHWLYGQAVTGWTSAAGSDTNADSAFNILFDGGTASTVEPSTRYSSSETQLLASANYGGPSPDGGNFMALDGDTQFNGDFFQTLTGLTAGKKYAVSFYWAGTQFQNRGGDTTIRLDVGFGGSTRSTPTFGGPTHYFEGWQKQRMTFTADGGTQVLSFLAKGTPNGLPPVALLDGVSVTAVPEPATWAMLILGFGLVGATVRRRADLRAAA